MYHWIVLKLETVFPLSPPTNSSCIIFAIFSIYLLSLNLSHVYFAVCSRDDFFAKSFNCFKHIISIFDKLDIFVTSSSHWQDSFISFSQCARTFKEIELILYRWYTSYSEWIELGWTGLITWLMKWISDGKCFFWCFLFLRAKSGFLYSWMATDAGKSDEFQCFTVFHVF